MNVAAKFEEMFHLILDFLVENNHLDKGVQFIVKSINHQQILITLTKTINQSKWCLKEAFLVQFSFMEP